MHALLGRLFTALIFSFVCVTAANAQSPVYRSTVLGTVNGNGPNGITIDAAGIVYVTVGNSVQKIDSAGSITLLAGDVVTSGSADGTGAGALFNSPVGLAIDENGTLYVADSGNNAIRKISPLGEVTTLAGLVQGFADGVGIAAKFNHPTVLACDRTGTLYVMDQGSVVRKVMPDGATTTLSGASGAVGVACDEDGNVYFSSTDAVYAGHANPNVIITRVFSVTQAGASAQLAEFSSVNLGGLPGLSAASSGALVVAGGSYYVSAENSGPGITLFKGALAGGSGTALQSISAGGTFSLAIDASGRLFTANSVSHAVSILSLVGTPPAIVTQPVGEAVAYGGSLTLTVEAAGTAPLHYQWSRDGTPISGATSASYEAAQPGMYSVVVSNAADQVTSDSVTVSRAARLVNVAARCYVGTGGNVQIAGFVVSGAPGSTKRVLIRAVGPSLARFGISDFLAEPVLVLHDHAGAALATNTRWGTSANSEQLATVTQQVGAFDLDLGSADSALLVDLPPGVYSAEVRGVNAGTGVALLEVYEVTSEAPELINLSCRAQVKTGNGIAIAGFVVRGIQPAKVLIRVVGPGLSPFGVTTPLAQPSLTIMDGNGYPLALNTGWTTAPDPAALASAAQAAGAFPLNPTDADCAILMTLAPGSYSAIMSGVNGTTGVGLIEVYLAP